MHLACAPACLQDIADHREQPDACVLPMVIMVRRATPLALSALQPAWGPAGKGVPRAHDGNVEEVSAGEQPTNS